MSATPPPSVAAGTSAGSLVDHFQLSEFTCHDGTPYPTAWITDETRLVALKLVLETIRQELGDKPIHILCGYRTPSYNQHLREVGLRGEGHASGVAVHSQHMEGRAADISRFGMHTIDLHDQILELYQHGKLPSLGGLGLYLGQGFVHVDVYKVGTKLRQWQG